MLIVRLLTFFGLVALVRMATQNRSLRQGQQRDDQHTSTAYNHSAHAGQEQPLRPLPPSSHSAGQAEEREHRRAERRHWNWNVILTATSTAGALGAAGFAAGALNASWDAVKAARDQVDIARRALIASDRPWVMLTDMKPDSFFSDDEAGVILRVNILVKNIGHSPAQNVSVTGRLLLDDFDPPPDQAMTSVCQEPRNGSFVIPGQALFPDWEQDLDGEIAHSFVIDAKKVWEARTARINSTREYNMSVGRPERAQAWAEALSKFPFYDGLNLVGCINYRSSDNTALYQTSFMFSVSAKPGGGGLPLLGGKRPIAAPPTITLEDPDVLVVHPRMIQRLIPGDQIRLEKPLYSTFAN